MTKPSTKNIKFPMRITVQNGQVETDDIQDVLVVCQTNRIVINISALNGIHPLEVNAIFDSFEQLGIHSLFDYIIFENEMDESIADMFARVAELRRYNNDWKRMILTQISKPFSQSMMPLKCICTKEQIPNPYGEEDFVTKFTFQRN